MSKPWRTGETRIYRYLSHSQPCPKGYQEIAFDSHHSRHSRIIWRRVKKRRAA